jgi:hypothetical protein
MKTGMLWFDSSTISASAKIFKGVDYFYKKYGKLPDLILLHPSMTEEKKPYELELRGIGRDLLSTKVTVRQYRPVLPGHIWIGIADIIRNRHEEIPAYHTAPAMLVLLRLWRPAECQHDDI